MKNCQQCRTELPDDYKFCNKCGTALEFSPPEPLKKTCQSCGFESSDGTNFCTECGSQFDTPETVPVQQPQQPPVPPKKSKSPSIFAIAGALSIALIVGAIAIIGNIIGDDGNYGEEEARKSRNTVSANQNDNPKKPFENVTDKPYMYVGTEKLYDSGEGFYTGEWLNGMPNGYGIFVYAPETPNAGSSYEGDWVDGKHEGYGKFAMMIHGSVYDGMYDIYEGEFKDNKRGILGKFTWANGDYFEGEFKDYTYDDTTTVWYDDIWTGVGRKTRYNWGVYTGEFKNGVPMGQGKVEYESGNIYEANFESVNGTILPVGEGRILYADGDIFEGNIGYYESADSIGPQGYGKQTYANGNVYEGNFGETSDNKIAPKGQGKKIYASGDVYEGEWKDGQKNGQGVYKDKSGKILYQGPWNNGKAVNMTNEKMEEIITGGILIAGGAAILGWLIDGGDSDSSGTKICAQGRNCKDNTRVCPLCGGCYTHCWHNSGFYYGPNTIIW